MEYNILNHLQTIVTLEQMSRACLRKTTFCTYLCILLLEDGQLRLGVHMSETLVAKRNSQMSWKQSLVLLV